MKLKITLFILVLTAFVNCSWAQPIITGISGVPTGTKTLGYVIPGAITAGAAGANQSWDYSSIVYNPYTYYMKSVDYASLSSTMKAAFPTGNIANEYYVGTTLTATMVFRLEASDLLYLGLNTTVFPAADTQLVFPHNYLETHAGFTYDAYGTLKTPFGTYTNVVRLRETVGTKYKYDYWQFTPAYKLLMEYSVEISTLAISGQTFFNTVTTTGINEELNSINQIDIYPNPTSGIVKIDYQNNKNMTVKIFNSTGEEINLQQTGNEIDFSNAPKGIYFIRINDGTKNYSKKIFIQ